MNQNEVSVWSHQQKMVLVTYVPLLMLSRHQHQAFDKNRTNKADIELENGQH